MSLQSSLHSGRNENKKKKKSTPIPSQILGYYPYPCQNGSIQLKRRAYCDGFLPMGVLIDARVIPDICNSAFLLRYIMREANPTE